MSKYLRKNKAINPANRSRVFVVYHKIKDLFSMFREAKPLVAFNTEQAAELYCYKMQSMCSWEMFYDILDLEQ